MKKQVRDGEILHYSNSGSAIASGDVVVIGNRVGVAIVDIAATSGSGAVQMEGVFLLPKTTSQAWTQGAQLFWDGSLLTTVGTANTPAGYADVAADSADSTGYVNLSPLYKKATVIAALGTTSNLVGVDGAGSNAAPLAGTESRLDAIESKVDALIAALKVAGLMANS
jgi:predicted RecA/RadA family phage recombinase